MTKGDAPKREVLNLRDFTGIEKALLSDSQDHYCCMITTDYAFPAAVQDAEWARGAWVVANQAKCMDLDFEDQYSNLVRDISY